MNSDDAAALRLPAVPIPAFGHRAERNLFDKNLFIEWRTILLITAFKKRHVLLCSEFPNSRQVVTLEFLPPETKPDDMSFTYSAKLTLSVCGKGLPGCC